VWNVYDRAPLNDTVDNPDFGYPSLVGQYGRRKFSGMFTIWTAYRCFNSTAQPGATSYTWQDIATTGTSVGALVDNNMYGPFPIGFAFSFFGNSFNQVRISNNGSLTFNLGDTIGWVNQTIPTVGVPNNVVAPFWDDLFTAGQIRYQTLGTAPNRYFVVSWIGLNHVAVPGNFVTFQAILCETSGIIVFQYEDVDLGNVAFDNGASATVGIENATASPACAEYSFNRALLADSLAICYIPNVYAGAQPYWPISAEPGGGGGGGSSGGGGGGGCLIAARSSQVYTVGVWLLLELGALALLQFAARRRSRTM
jgi:hypothetical protein